MFVVNFVVVLLGSAVCPVFAELIDVGDGVGATVVLDLVDVKVDALCVVSVISGLTGFGTCVDFFVWLLVLVVMDWCFVVDGGPEVGTTLGSAELWLSFGGRVVKFTGRVCVISSIVAVVSAGFVVECVANVMSVSLFSGFSVWDVE